jgi:O-antigen ligase
MIKKNPIMGVGPGNFIITYPYYATGEAEALRGTSLLVDSVHNDYLEVCAEAGIVGFVLFLYLLFLSFGHLLFYTGAQAGKKNFL